jgi:ribosomal protein S18 acetylase RimI-like enzyme
MAKIRLGTREDIPAVVRLQLEAFGMKSRTFAAFYSDSLRACVGCPASRLFVAEMDGQVVGFLSVRSDQDAFVRYMRRPAFVLSVVWRVLTGAYGLHAAAWRYLIADTWSHLLASRRAGPSASRERVAHEPRANAVRGMIGTIAVDERYRRHGIATQLLERGHRWLRDVGVASVCAYVAADNNASISFFRQAGYEEIGREVGVGGATRFVMCGHL